MIMGQVGTHVLGGNGNEKPAITRKWGFLVGVFKLR